VVSDLQIDMRGIVFASAEVRTVGDLRELLNWCNTYGVHDESQLDWGVGVVHLDIIENGSAEWIEDGDTVPPDRHWNVIVDVQT